MVATLDVVEVVFVYLCICVFVYLCICPAMCAVELGGEEDGGDPGREASLAAGNSTIQPQGGKPSDSLLFTTKCL